MSKPPYVPVGKPNVVILLLDCLRADHLGVNGYHRDTTPVLDQLASEGVNFTQAFAQAQWTRPSVPALLTGLYPSEHGVVSLPVGESDATAGALSPEAETLAESLKEHGYETALIGEQFQLSRRFGLNQGFDLYNNGARKAWNINREFMEWATAREGQPFFAYLHYLDAHMPYCPPETTRGRFQTGDGKASKCLASRKLIREVRNGQAELSSGEVTEIIAAYDEEIAGLDADLGELFGEMKKQGLWEDTLIIVTSDHGESFLEHGSIGHKTGLYDELIHVPLIIKHPASWNGSSGVVVDDLVELRDVAPTVLEALGDEPALRRHSLLPWLVGRGSERPARRYVVSESSGEVSVRTAGLKLISAREGGEAMLFDLVADPGETENLAGERREELARLRGYLDEWQAGLIPLEVIEEQIDDETLEGLKSLGYLD